MTSSNPTNYVLMKSELRRSYAHLSGYKSDVVILSGLDAGDRIALSTRFEGAGETPCQYDKEDRRFVLKGPHFAPMEVLNCLAQERGYKIAFFPQQHAIPNHPGAMDDKFTLIYQLTKDIIPETKPKQQPKSEPKKKLPVNKTVQKQQIYSVKCLEKLMHGKIDSSEKRRPEDEDSESDKLSSIRDEEKELQMNEYDNDENIECGEEDEN